MSERIEGLIAAVFTPMREDGSLRLDAVERLVEHHIACGIAGLYVTGSTGEGVSLTHAERCLTIEAWTRAAAGRLPVIAQVGHNCLEEARELAAYAARVGVTAISAAPPTYFKPTGVPELIDCMRRVADGAPSLPFYYYHIPSMTGVDLDMVELLERADGALPSLAGVKFTSSDMPQLQACVEAVGGRYQVFSGLDEMLLSGLAHGVVAAVGSTYNFAAPVYEALRAAFARGDVAEARRCQSRSIAIVRILTRSRPLPAQKAIMKLIGLDCGPTRLPQVPLDPAELETLRAELERIGYFAWGVTPA